MIRLIAPPLPAASRPSKTIDDPLALGAHPLLQLDQLALQPQQLGLVLLAREPRRLVVLRLLRHGATLRERPEVQTGAGGTPV